MANKIFKIGLAVLGMVFGAAEIFSGTKDLVSAIKEEAPEEEKSKEAEVVEET